MGSHQCCCSNEEKEGGTFGTCCESGCECWDDVYEAGVPSLGMGRTLSCDCCASCYPDPFPDPQDPPPTEGKCCAEIPFPTNAPCNRFADSAQDIICKEHDWEIIGGSVKLFRTGSWACGNGPLVRTCTDPWSPMTQTAAQTGKGCNVYETDYGIDPNTSDFAYPCPGVPDLDYYEIKITRKTYGDAAEVVAPGSNLCGQRLKVQTMVEQVQVPVVASISCCSRPGTSKLPCVPCPGTSLPGSGIPHILEIIPLAAISYVWSVWVGPNPTDFQNFNFPFFPPILRFIRRLSCNSTPAGEWQFLNIEFNQPGAFPCEAPAGWSGICRCFDRTQYCVTDCEDSPNSLCDCDYIPPPGLGCGTGANPVAGLCPGCAGQDPAIINSMTMAVST